MNIDDVKQVDEVEEEQIWLTIFGHQRKLMEQYDEIERRAGAIVPEAPYMLDDKRVQWRLKDLFWRVMEELAEALEYQEEDLLLCWEERWDESADVRHVFEELADALHFFVEASIVSGEDELVVRELDRDVRCSLRDYPKAVMGRRVLRPRGVLKQFAWEIVYQLGLAANTLKNKPWKQTHMPTDRGQFQTHFWKAWSAFHKMWASLGCSRLDVFRLYFKKMRVNQFRQESKY